jgi:hypothetical protein
MRPTAQPQSSLRAPLNKILSTEAHVRVLRALAPLTEPIVVAELARKAQLQPSTVHRALVSLEQTGTIQFSGARLLVSLREEGPMSAAIRNLFTHEQGRYEAVIDALHNIGKSLPRPPLAMWIEGSVAQGVDQTGDPLIVVVVDGARELGKVREEVRKAAEHIEENYDVTIEVRGRTVADLEADAESSLAALANVIPLAGVTPMGLLTQNNPTWQQGDFQSHAVHDVNAMALGVSIAKTLLKNPALVERARLLVERRWRTASASERKELDEWRSILRTSSPARLRRVLTDPGERSTRLRQTLPFIGIFSEDDLRDLRANKP